MTSLADTKSVILWYIRGNIRPSDSACSCNLVEYTECPRPAKCVLSTTDTTDQTRKRWLLQFQDINSNEIIYKIEK